MKRIKWDGEGLTKKSGVSVLSSRSGDIGPFSVSDENVWSLQRLEYRSIVALPHKNRAIEMPFSHMVHVDCVQQRTCGGGSNFPDGASKRMPRIEGDNGQALTFS